MLPVAINCYLNMLKSLEHEILTIQQLKNQPSAGLSFGMLTRTLLFTSK